MADKAPKVRRSPPSSPCLLANRCLPCKQKHTKAHAGVKHDRRVAATAKKQADKEADQQGFHDGKARSASKHDKAHNAKVGRSPHPHLLLTPP